MSLVPLACLCSSHEPVDLGNAHVNSSSAAMYVVTSVEEGDKVGMKKCFKAFQLSLEEAICPYPLREIKKCRE